MSHITPISNLPSLTIPNNWTAWSVDRHPSSITFVQDTVHIAVKLKSRLLKHSIVLPMGIYVAGVQHLRMLHSNFGKDLHGLRERDIDSKDKQNFDAVLNIIRAAPHLLKIPDALATKHYIEVIQCVVDSYCKKSLEPLERVEKIWYALFFFAILAQCIQCIH